ncbi:ERG24 reductase, partial [Callaeas wilsoni]|nr:ERG24 reductase [Callaeas wilsoni]
ALGLWIFHGATTQRSLFIRDPRDPRVAGETPQDWDTQTARDLQIWEPRTLGPLNHGTPQTPVSPPGLPTVPTATGQVLLAGGWWGLVRRPDDLGELLMALGWTLPCGLSPPLLLLLVGAVLRELRA